MTMLTSRTYFFSSRSGFITPYAVFALIILSLLGIMAAANSMVEGTISGNIKAMKINLYNAEGVAIEAARSIENELDSNLRQNKLVLPDSSQIVISSAVNVVPQYIAEAMLDPDNTIPHYNTLLQRSGFRIIGKGATEGESLDIGIGDYKTYKYQIFGVSDSGGLGRKVVEIGYIRSISLTE